MRREKKERGAYHGGPSSIKRILLFQLNSIRVDRLIVRSRSRTCGRVVTSAVQDYIGGGTARRNARRQEIPLVLRHECNPHVRRTIGQKGLIRPRRFHPTFRFQSIPPTLLSPTISRITMHPLLVSPSSLRFMHSSVRSN